ncbi:hypothetical protein CRUP_029394 [Coryphaenoides rupestris]|nr:hypothetical protein CRUP_029394 [Coryphaenoides rupestris]
MMMLFVILLSCVAVSRSAPLSCDDLNKPLAQMRADHLEGRWALVAGSLNHPASLEALKRRDSITAFFRNANQTSNHTVYAQVNRFGDDRCERRAYRLSLHDGAFTFLVDGGRFNLTGVFLRTSCPDCLVMRWDVESPRRVSLDAYLLSSGRREVEQAEMEEYRAQLECLGLPPPVVMSPSAELCPEEAGTTIE